MQSSGKVESNSNYDILLNFDRSKEPEKELKIKKSIMGGLSVQLVSKEEKNGSLFTRIISAIYNKIAYLSDKETAKVLTDMHSFSLNTKETKGIDQRAQRLLIKSDFFRQGITAPQQKAMRQTISLEANYIKSNIGLKTLQNSITKTNDNSDLNGVKKLLTDTSYSNDTIKSEDRKETLEIGHQFHADFERLGKFKLGKEILATNKNCQQPGREFDVCQKLIGKFGLQSFKNISSILCQSSLADLTTSIATSSGGTYASGHTEGISYQIEEKGKMVHLHIRVPMRILKLDDPEGESPGIVFIERTVIISKEDLAKNWSNSNLKDCTPSMRVIDTRSGLSKIDSDKTTKTPETPDLSKFKHYDNEEKKLILDLLETIPSSFEKMMHQIDDLKGKYPNNKEGSNLINDLKNIKMEIESKTIYLEKIESKESEQWKNLNKLLEPLQSSYDTIEEYSDNFKFYSDFNTATMRELYKKFNEED
jgi:hypothetical protein